MPPKKKTKTSATKKNSKPIPSDAQWCLNKGEDLTFKQYIERCNSLDKNQAQQRFGRILSDHYTPKTALYNKIDTEYKTWTASADYLRFWKDRLDTIIKLKADLGSNELISDATDNQIEYLRSRHAKTSSQIAPSTRSQTVAKTRSQTASTSSSDSSSSNDSPPTSADSSTLSGAGPDETIQVTHLTHHHLLQIKKNFISKQDINDEPYIINNINISELCSQYQYAVMKMLESHKSLPIESYIHEVASLTNIFCFCKNQHSEIAKKIFTSNVLKELETVPGTETPAENLRFSLNDFMTINTSINNLSQEKIKREAITLELLTLASGLNYGPKRLLMGMVNL
jgi:hypothetical protein